MSLFLADLIFTAVALGLIALFFVGVGPKL
jgi:hypothetical protein